MGEASDDGDDYMSDKFLTESSESKTSLLWGKHARDHVLQKRKREAEKISRNSKPRKLMEKEKREEGLQTKLTHENKGFAMLQKMGYRSGEGLGKNKSGRIEPIPIAVKANKAGLGKEEHEKRKWEARAKYLSFLQARKRKQNDTLQTDFRSRVRGKFNDRQFESDLYKSQKVCHQLHCEDGIDSPEFQFFWPAQAVDVDNEEDDKEDLTEDSFSVEDKLYILTRYLREQYFYCLWCAIRFSDTQDLSQNCPGDKAQDHDD